MPFEFLMLSFVAMSFYVCFRLLMTFELLMFFSFNSCSCFLLFEYGCSSFFLMLLMHFEFLMLLIGSHEFFFWYRLLMTFEILMIFVFVAHEFFC